MKKNHRPEGTDRYNFTVIAGFLAFCAMAPMTAQAVGLGPLRVFSQSGQPLRAEVELVLADRKEASGVTVNNASAEEYARQGFGARGPLASMRVVIEQRGDKRVALLTTTQPLNDTYTNIILEGASGNGSALRSYPVLLSVAALKERPARPMVIERVLNGPITSADFPEPVIASRSLSARAPAVNDAMRIYENLIEIGQRPGAKGLQRLTATGNREPVGSAFSRVVPKGWRGFAGDVNVKELAPISWTARNDYWIKVLDGMMSNTALTATINWSDKEVTFRGLDSTSVTKAPSVVADATPPPALAPVLVVAVPVHMQKIDIPVVTETAIIEAPRSQGIGEQLHLKSRIATLMDRLAELEARDAAMLAAKSSKAPANASVVLEPEKLTQATPEQETKIVNAVAVKTGTLTLDTAVRDVLPSDWSFLSNNQSALHLPRVAGANNSQDWLASIQAMVTSQGGTVMVDTEKKRLLVSLVA